MPTECDVQDAQAVQEDGQRGGWAENGMGRERDGQKNGIRCMQPSDTT
jgi:hypothetical protein